MMKKENIQIKINKILEKGKLIYQNWNNEKNIKININNSIDIENNIDYFKNIKENLKNFHSIDYDISFCEGDNDKEKIITKINTFGYIYINKKAVNSMENKEILNTKNPSPNIKLDNKIKNAELNNTYDIIILGTGLKECILASLFYNYKKENIKIFQLDNNNYFGSYTTSLNLSNLWKYFKRKEKYQKQYGENIEWNVDLIPKFVIANGTLVKILLKTNAYKYLEWKILDSMYICNEDKGNMFSKKKLRYNKMPTTASEALKSDAIGLLQKNRCKNFLKSIRNFETNKSDYEINKIKDIINKFHLEPIAIYFIGHALALYTNDDFLEEKTINIANKINLYIDSFDMYGKTSFIYPIWGLGRLSEAFMRIYSLNENNYIVNQDIEEILYDENGNFKGIISKGKYIYGKILISEPSYINKWNKVKSIGKVIRRICILNHPISEINKYNDSINSYQIIYPGKLINKKNDILISILNHEYYVCKKGYYLAIISTIVEKKDANQDISPVMEIISPVLDYFDQICDIFVPLDKSLNKKNIYITSSLDDKFNFEDDMKDVIFIYEAITGTKINL